MNWKHLRERSRRLAGDEEGAMMVEYVILLSIMVVAFIWLNKTADAVLFGASPYAVFNNPAMTESLDADLQGARIESEIDYITGGPGKATSDHPDRAYLSQIYRHLARP